MTPEQLQRLRRLLSEGLAEPINTSELDDPVAPPPSFDISEEDPLGGMMPSLIGTQGTVGEPLAGDTVTNLDAYLEEYYANNQTDPDIDIDVDTNTDIVNDPSLSDQLVDYISNAADEISNMTLEDFLDTIKDIYPEVTDQTIANDILGPAVGATFPNMGGSISDIIASGEVFIPGIPGPVSGGNITIGTIEDLLNPETVLGTLQQAGEDIWNNILVSVENPGSILTDVFGGIDGVPDWLSSGIINGTIAAGSELADIFSSEDEDTSLGLTEYDDDLFNGTVPEATPMPKPPAQDKPVPEATPTPKPPGQDKPVQGSDTGRVVYSTDGTTGVLADGTPVFVMPGDTVLEGPTNTNTPIQGGGTTTVNDSEDGGGGGMLSGASSGAVEFAPFSPSVGGDPALLRRSEFPISDYLSSLFTGIRL